MPSPFEWCEIPNKDYSVAKYPLTNAQFAKFIEAGGYNNQKWWTDAGWQQKQRDNWTEPDYWSDSDWNGADYPVVGVSWYESVAFCLWLSDTTGEKIMLPTEEQWQYAAQGDDGRDYPWGNNWNRNFCNNKASKKGNDKTTPVRQYEGKGNSPFAVVDMSGNVLEWCLTDYDNETNDVNSDVMRRAMRGGAWNDLKTDYFRCDYRDRGMSIPKNRGKGIGFRVSRSN